METRNSEAIEKNNKNQKRLLLLLVGLIVLIGGAYLLYANLSGRVEPNQLSSQGNAAAENNEELTESEKAGEASAQEVYPAPDVTFFDPEGNEVKLSDFQGKPVILNFWASWCGPCKSEMATFNAAYLQHGIHVQFLMVNMTDGYRETQKSGQKLIEEQGYVFPVYYDLEQDAAITYGVNSIPTTYFLDAEGNFVAYANGALDATSLQRGIDMLLGK